MSEQVEEDRIKRECKDRTIQALEKIIEIVRSHELDNASYRIEAATVERPERFGSRLVPTGLITIDFSIRYIDDKFTVKL